MSRSRAPFQRRRFLQICAAGASLLPLAACGDGTEIQPPPEEAAGGGGGAPPNPDESFPVPPLDEGELVDGVRVFRLKLQQGSMEWVEGVPTATYGVNGPCLGPTLRFHKGERVRLEVTNELGEVSTLHWHGMEVPAAADGGPYQTVAPGATWISEYDVIQRAFTAWYHPHPMHQTARHVYMGMAGMIFVEDPAQAIDLPSTYGVDDIPLVIQDRRFAADGTHPYSPGNAPTMHDRMAGLRGSTMLVNGLRDLKGTVPSGLVRLRLLNGSNARIYNLGFADGRSFQHIASDGGLLEAPVTTTRVLLAPGERAEILVDFGGDAQGATVALASYSGEVFTKLFQGNMGANLADELDQTTFEIMTFEVGAPPAATHTPPQSFEPIARMVEADAGLTRTIALAMVGGTVTINGEAMMDLGAVPAAIDFQIPEGSIELWELTNSSGMAHPIHLHNRHFQVLDIGGQPPPGELAGWKDTVIVGPGQLVRILVEFKGTVDPDHPYMFHCHILEHEDMGMMGQFVLVD
jgi:blue copper oxidase